MFSRLEMVHRDENENDSFRLPAIVFESLSDFNLNKNGKGYEKISSTGSVMASVTVRKQALVLSLPRYGLRRLH